MKMKLSQLPIGTEIDIYEYDGYESENGKIIRIENDYVVIKCKNASGERTLKLKNSNVNRFEISVTTKANELSKYEVD